MLRSPMSDSEPPDPLAQLGKRLERARRREGGPVAGADRAASPEGMGLGLRIGIEFVVAVVVATVLGWAIDRWLGTRPWGTIVLFFLGVGAGMMSVYRAVAGIRTPVGYRRLAADERRPEGGRTDGERDGGA